MEISSGGVYFICPHCSWVKKKTFFPKTEEEAPEIKKKYYLPKIYNELTSGLTLGQLHFELAKTMCNALVQFILFQNEFCVRRVKKIFGPR